MKLRKFRYFILCIGLFFSVTGFGQYMDDFSNAARITIGNQGYDTGTFYSDVFPLSLATIESNEYFPDALVRASLIEKSIWYKFTIPTRRDIKISLKQRDTLIDQQDLGMVVYKDPQGFGAPHYLSDAFPIMNKMGFVENSCLEAGEYYVQVVSRLRCTDTVWVEIEVKQPNAKLADFYHLPVDTFFYSGNYSSTIRMNLLIEDCPTFPDQQVRALSPAGTGWNQTSARFRIDEGFDVHILKLSDFLWSTQKARVYLLKEDSILDLSQWQILLNQDISRKDFFNWDLEFAFGCSKGNNLQSGVYRLLIFYPEALSQSLIHAELDRGKNAGIPNGNPLQIPGIYQNLNLSYRFYDTLSCDSRIDSLVCPQLNTNLLNINSQGDSFQLTHQVWYTFERKKEERGEFSFRLNNRITGTANFRIELYEGDISQGCSQVSLLEPDGKYYCIHPGTYTLRILFANNTDLSGSKFDFQGSFTEQETYTYKFNDSLQPEILGDIIQKFPQQTLSVGDVYDNIPQAVFLGDHWDTASFQYREFYISSPAPVHLVVDKPSTVFISSSVDGYVFKGRKSKGTGNTLVDFIPLDKKYSCGFPDTGWYTLVTKVPTYEEKCRRKGIAPYGMIFMPLTANIPSHSEGTLQNPYRYNNGLPLQGGSTQYKGKNYPAIQTYAPPSPYYFTCTDQNLTLFNKLKKQCGDLPGSQDCFLYAEFELDTAVQLRFAEISKKSFLVRGSVSQNPALIEDTSNWVTPCETSIGSYCNLQPGKYTVVCQGDIGDFSTMSIVVSSLINYPEEHIESFYDLGLIQNPVEVPPFHINCAMLWDSTDIQLSYGNGKIQDWLPDIKYVSRQNTTWYYFELNQAGILEFTTDLSVQVYQVPDSFDVQLLKINPALRSQLVASLVGKSVSKTYGTQINKFYKGDCTPGKYFVKLSYSDKEELATCILNWQALAISGNKGDQCTTSDITQISSLTTVKKKLDSRCMTLGGGFGEDGNNMACLPLKNKEYVSLWHQIHVDPGMRYDIRFNIKGLPGINVNNAVKYRILYGSCSALTPGPCVENLNASFGFECMESADFYLQIIVPKDWGSLILNTEQLELTIEVSAAAQAICKPFDPFRPLAAFNFDGQCDADSVHFRNYGSQGTDIRYLWNFGDGDTSSEKDPVHWFKATQATQDFQVKLVVENLLYGKKDSVTRLVRVRKEPLRIDIPFSDTLVQCGTRLKIEAQPNFTDGVMFFVSSYNYDTIQGNQVDLIFNKAYSQVKFIGFAGNCVIDTSLIVNIHQQLNRLSSDSFICKDQVLHLDLSPYQNVIWTPGNHQSPTLDWDMPGELRVEVKDNGCSLRDTMQIEDKRRVFLHSTDTLFCESDSGLLSVLPIYSGTLVWEDGSTQVDRWVHQDGIYWMEGRFDACLNRDTVKVQFADFRDAILATDYGICLDSSIQLESRFHADQYIWNTGESTKEIIASDTGLYTLRLGSRHCFASDQANVKYYPMELDLGSDTGFCGNIVLTLDAGDGSEWYWSPSGINDRYFTIPDSGTYRIQKINRYNCPESDTIQIFENCGPWFLMPTAFSPNGDGLNDDLRWITIDVTEFDLHIYNRWGEEVYSTTNKEDHWNGTYRGALAGEGVYIYRITYGGYDYLGKYYRKSDKGVITLLK